MQAQLDAFKILRPVHYVELNQREDLKRLLYESMEADVLSLTIEELLDGIESRECVLWTWGDGKGILVTEVRDLPRGRVLYVTNVRGEGYLKFLPEIDSDVESYAKSIQCNYLVGEVASEGLLRMYQKRGAVVMHRVLREVK